MNEDKYGKNMEAAESRILFLWQFCMAVSLLYLMMFVAIHWNPEVRAIQGQIDSLGNQIKQRDTLRQYEVTYFTAGAKALYFTLRDGEDSEKSKLYGELTEACRCKQNFERTRVICRGLAVNKIDTPDFPEILTACASWSLFKSLLLSPESVVHKELHGGGTRTVYYGQEVDGVQRVDQDEKIILSLPKETGLSDLEKWDANVVDSIDHLAKIHAEEVPQLAQSQLTVENKRATGQFRIPAVDKSVDALPLFWVGGFLLFLASYFLRVAVGDRADILSEWQKKSNCALTWEKAVTKYVVKIPWMLPNERTSKDKLSWWLASALPIVTAGSAISIVVYCLKFPVEFSGPVSYGLASSNFVFGTLAVWELFKTWRELAVVVTSNTSSSTLKLTTLPTPPHSATEPGPCTSVAPKKAAE